jgi:glycosyltransferase involved in cell wall biosynthesis
MLEVSEIVDDYFLMVGRLIPYKRADIVVEAFNKLGLPLKVVGDGSEMETLKSRAKSNVEFLGRVPDRALGELYSRCRAFIFPQKEDLGITPLEAMAAGRPVIAYRAGGALETVVEGETGIFFERQDAQSLVEIISAYEQNGFKPERLREYAEQFDEGVFKRKIDELVNSTWERFRRGEL